jgi:hypothetical protein
VLFILSAVAMLFLMMIGRPCRGLGRSASFRPKFDQINEPTKRSIRSFRVQLCSDSQGVWVQLGNHMKRRVDLEYTPDVCLGSVSCCNVLIDKARLTLTRSTLVKFPASRPNANSSVVASSSKGNDDGALYCAYTLVSGATARIAFARNHAETMIPRASETIQPRFGNKLRRPRLPESRVIKSFL